ncbi:MAG TPA: cation:proton antiporter [Methylophilaceae bacterium]|nr:cation:proton antiporter [Methylophilaceae bacterium]
MNYLPTWPLEVTPLITFGLLLLIGSIGGYLAHRISWLPSVTGFLLVGFTFGTGGIGLLNHEVIAQAQIFTDVALALILYRLGLSLDIRAISKFPRLLIIALFEGSLTFGLVFLVLYLLGVDTLIATLVGTIAISSSPAVLLHVAHEVEAKGVVTDSTMTLVALNNLFSFVAFSAVIPVMHYSSGSDWTTIILQPTYQLLGSLVLGLVVAYGLHAASLKTHQASQYKLALVIGAIMISVGLANELKLSALFAPLIIGVVIKTIERKTVVSNLEFGAAFELFFIVLFVFAGANLHMKELIHFAPAVLALVVVRCLAKTVGATFMSVVLGRTFRVGVSSGMLLIPMAGLAIGLVHTSSQLFPQNAAMIAAIVLGAVTVFETIGPPIASFAFRLSGESGAMRDKEDVGESAEARPASPAQQQGQA